MIGAIMRRKTLVVGASAGALALTSLFMAGLPGSAEEGPEVSLGGGLEPGGYLLLDLGATDQVSYLEDASDTTPVVQTITESSNKKCQVDPTTGPLVTFAASPGAVGINKDGLGNRSGSGRSCGEVTGEESISIKLVSGGPSDPLSDRLISHAEVDVQAKAEGAPSCVLGVTYKLRGAVVGSESIALSSGGGDCDNDSGPSDNYRVVLEPTSSVDEIVFTAESGVISLHGGADGTPAAPAPSAGATLGTLASVFVLDQVDGLLDCPFEPNGLPNVYTQDGVTLTRIDEPDTCIPVSFSLQRDGNQLTFLKDLEDQPFAEFTLDITWDPEPAVYPGRVTEIDYFDGNGFNPMVFCGGTTALPSLELADGGPGDQIPATPSLVDGGCIASQSTVLVGGGLMQDTEKIYLISDPRFR
jgi:hypothetical protein